MEGVSLPRAASAASLAGDPLWEIDGDVNKFSTKTQGVAFVSMIRLLEIAGTG